MSVSSMYSEERTIEVEFNDGTNTVIYINIPLELTLDINNFNFSHDNVIEFDEQTKSRLQKQYVRDWVNRNLQNVKSILDDWED